MNYEEYTEADYQADRAAGHLDAWEHATASNYAALDVLIDAMRIDLLIQEALYGQSDAPAL